MKKTLYYERPSKTRRIILTFISGVLFAGIVVLMIIFNTN